MSQPEYGVTPSGFVRKRLDTICSELHTHLSEGWKVNTGINPQSFLNVLVTGFADKIAELWEVAEDEYFAMYPSTATDTSLDNAVQYGGVRRLDERATYFYIRCTGDDGSTIPKGTMIQSETKPPINLRCAETKTISRLNFNQVSIRVAALQRDTTYIIGINDRTYRITTGTDPTATEIFSRLKALMTEPDLKLLICDERLSIADSNPLRESRLLLSENLTTYSVSSVLLFNTEQYGQFKLPEGTVTTIVKNVPGLHEVINETPPILGRTEEDDIRLRQSYIGRIYSRSQRMIESIESEIRDLVQGISRVKGYENENHFYDDEGRPPHSIEIIADGGDDIEIARCILNKGTDGIQTFGSVVVHLPGDAQTLPVRFNRPTPLYCWLRVTLSVNNSKNLPPNYAELTKNSILEEGAPVGFGEVVILQRFLSSIYGQVTGVHFVRMEAFSATDLDINPESLKYQERNIKVGTREKAVFDADRIEVLLDDIS